MSNTGQESKNEVLLSLKGPFFECCFSKLEPKLKIAFYWNVSDPNLPKIVDTENWYPCSMLGLLTCIEKVFTLVSLCAFLVVCLYTWNIVVVLLVALFLSLLFPWLNHQLAGRARPVCLFFVCVAVLKFSICLWLSIVDVHLRSYASEIYCWWLCELDRNVWSGSCLCRPEARQHDGIMMWLVKWLLFRLMFASGIVKLTSQCPTWWGLTGQ